ncbi:hypothetical protein DMP11_06830 [Parvibacter caecicola]|nr:hypothetical protein DMP11_06830 [Parvibacter caecicola]
MTPPPPPTTAPPPTPVKLTPTTTLPTPAPTAKTAKMTPPPTARTAKTLKATPPTSKSWGCKPSPPSAKQSWPSSCPKALLRRTRCCPLSAMKPRRSAATPPTTPPR